MLKFSKSLLCSLLLAALCWLQPAEVLGQSAPVYLLNQEEVNFKTGVSLETLSKEEKVVLSVKTPLQEAVFDTLVLYLARGNRPLIMQKASLKGHPSMEIGQVLKSARAGDRLVLELQAIKEGDETIAVISLH